MKTPHTQPFYPIGEPGRPWGQAERVRWRDGQSRARSHVDDVCVPIESMGSDFTVLRYGEVVTGTDGTDGTEGDTYPLYALRTTDWQAERPSVLVTGGVHGYESSGVHGALHFAAKRASMWKGRVNLLIVPCVSPWAYERIQRWNAHAVDPNRSFRQDSPAEESAALMRLVAQWEGKWAAHIDLHETTDSDESEFRPAVAARDGQAFVPGSIPDGFYLVADSSNPQLDFQQAIIRAVARVTHIALPDATGHLIGTPVLAHGVIGYPVSALGLCTGITGAKFTTTTEVYPDSPRTTPEQCVEAQVTAIEAVLSYVTEGKGQA